MITAIGAEKALDKNPTLFHDLKNKPSKNRELCEKKPQLHKGRPCKPHRQQFTCWWKSGCFLLKTRTKRGMSAA